MDDEPKDQPAESSEQPSDDQSADGSEKPAEESADQPAAQTEQPTDEQQSEESEPSQEKSEVETPSGEGEKSSSESDKPAEKSEDQQSAAQPSEEGQTSSEESEQTPAEQSADQSAAQPQPAKSDSGSGSQTKPASADDDFRKRCADLLAKHEGRMKHVYLDTLQIPSIGIGFNLKRGGARQAIEKVGADYDKILAGTQDLTDTQIDQLFSSDLDTALAAAHRQVANFEDLAFNARLVVVDMMFMGEAAFAQFKKMIAALGKRDYNAAADEMKNSQWYVQVKNRGAEDVALMRAAVNQ